MVYLGIIQQALVWIVTIFWLYQLIVSICSLVKLKDKPILEDKQNKFMAIISSNRIYNFIATITYTNLL